MSKLYSVGLMLRNSGPLFYPLFEVHEMEEEVERDRLIRDSLELELQALRKRLLMVENSRSMDMKSSGELSTKDQFSRSESSCGLIAYRMI